MKHFFSFCIALLFITSTSCSQPSTSKSAPSVVVPSEEILGDWTGSLSIQGQKIPLVIHLKETDGTLKGTLDSPNQGAFGLPCNQVIYKDAQLSLQLDNLGIVYKGTLEQGSIKGTFQQNGMEFPLTLNHTSKTMSPKRPQVPQAPFDYKIQAITFSNPSANIQLAGTLTMPADGQDCPAVVLISGSGPQDRNETLLGHQPFWVIADHLTRHGIAVLRFDDRGVGASEGNFETATSADFMTDAAAAVAFLQQQQTINPNQIGILGHSEGGLIAPMLAAQNPDIAFIVSLAGPGMAGKDLLPEQNRAIATANGASEEEAAQYYAQSKKACTLIAESSDKEQLRQALTTILEEQGISGKQLENTLQQYTTPWFLYFMRYDPSKAWEQVKCPVLALNGAKDMQVPADNNLAGIADALKKGGNTTVTILKLDNLNHLFQHATTGAPSEYASIEETFAEEALILISNWINQL